MPGPYQVIALPGEGAGPEVTEAALRVLTELAALHGLGLELERSDFGIPAFERTGSHFPDATARRCAEADGILLGAVERGGLLEIRSHFDLFANLRPVRAVDCLLGASSLRPERVRGLDILFVRELTSGIHFGASGRSEDARGPHGFHTMLYTDDQIRRIARVALERARERSGRLTLAHKENALPRIPWRALLAEEAESFPGVGVEALLVDNLAMQLVMDPLRFDVILAGNLMGDWLSSIGGALVGSIGLLPSASLNEAGLGLYEPIHGTAPEIAGKGIANPLGAIGSASMMLAQWGEKDARRTLETAVLRVLEAGHRTHDLDPTRPEVCVSTERMADLVIAALPRAAEEARA